jgi:hypothetical protein
MVAKAQAQGLTFDPTMAAQYGTMPAKVALDALQETWTLVYGPPHPRPIAADAAVSNSVAVRVQYDPSYTPGNLQIDNGALAHGYALVKVVDENAI